jgi:hypothetical protein
MLGDITQQKETGGSPVQGQPRQKKEDRPCLKKQSKKNSGTCF